MDAKINGAERNTVEKNGGGKGSSRMKHRESTCFFFGFSVFVTPCWQFLGLGQFLN